MKPALAARVLPAFATNVTLLDPVVIRGYGFETALNLAWPIDLRTGHLRFAVASPAHELQLLPGVRSEAAP